MYPVSKHVRGTSFAEVWPQRFVDALRIGDAFSTPAYVRLLSSVVSLTRTISLALDIREQIEAQS